LVLREERGERKLSENGKEIESYWLDRFSIKKSVVFSVNEFFLMMKV
jgi:hypothetical protein